MTSKVLAYVACLLFGIDTLSAQNFAEDSDKLGLGKLGIDIRVGLNQASTGGVFHLTERIAINPNIFYRSEEQTNDFVMTAASGNTTTYNTYKESYFGVGGFLPIYVARIEDLHIRLMPGMSYMAGKFNRSQSTPTGVNYDQSANLTRITYQFLIGLQYALNKHLHVFGETGYNYSEYKAGFFSNKVSNFYSGNIGLIFYFN